EVGVELAHLVEHLDAPARQEAGVDAIGVFAQAQVDARGLNLIRLDVPEEGARLDLAGRDHRLDRLAGQDAGADGLDAGRGDFGTSQRLPLKTSSGGGGEV